MNDEALRTKKKFQQKSGRNIAVDVIKHEWIGRGRISSAPKLFMSSNLIKLALKHFLILLICLDNSSSFAESEKAKAMLGDGWKNLFRFRFTWNKI